MIQVSLQELMALGATLTTIAFTAGAWLATLRRYQQRVRRLERMYDELRLQLVALDGGKVSTRELPAWEDSGG